MGEGSIGEGARPRREGGASEHPYLRGKRDGVGVGTVFERETEEGRVSSMRNRDRREKREGGEGGKGGRSGEGGEEVDGNWRTAMDKL